MRNTNAQDQCEKYQNVIRSQEYFEANIDFISQLAEIQEEAEKVAKDTLPSFNKRFETMLRNMGKETLLLKREKVKPQFRKNLLVPADQCCMLT